MRIAKDSVSQFYEHDLHLETRTLYIGDTSENGEVDALVASRVIKSLHLMSAQNNDPIKVLLNTLGGCLHNGLAIFDAIHDCKCFVTVEVIGSAMSMGAIILQAADERVMHPNATLMLHDGSMAIESNSRDFENWAAFNKLSRKMMYRLFSDRAGRTVAYWEKKCATDYILSSTQALKEGLIDRIIERPVNEA